MHQKRKVLPNLKDSFDTSKDSLNTESESEQVLLEVKEDIVNTLMTNGVGLQTIKQEVLEEKIKKRPDMLRQALEVLRIEHKVDVPKKGNWVRIINPENL